MLQTEGTNPERCSGNRSCGHQGWGWGSSGCSLRRHHPETAAGVWAESRSGALSVKLRSLKLESTQKIVPSYKPLSRALKRQRDRSEFTMSLWCRCASVQPETDALILTDKTPIAIQGLEKTEFAKTTKTLPLFLPPFPSLLKKLFRCVTLYWVEECSP